MSPRLPQAVAVVAIFVLAGPLAGALAFAVLMTLLTMLEGDNAGMLFVYAALAFLPLAYLIGGAQAAVTGLVTAAFAWRNGSAPAWVPLAAALAAGAVGASRSHEDWQATAILLAVHLLSALFCWLLARSALGWNGRPPAA